MKKALALFIAIMMAFTLAACGENNEKPSGNIGDIGDGGAQSSTANPHDNSDVPAPGETKVETKSDRIISTMNDGAGNLAVTEYIYKDGALSEIVMTMQCADAASAKTLYDNYATGALKEYGEQLYSDIKQDGKNVVCTYKENQLASFSGFNMEQLAEMLDGGDPFSSGETIGGTPSGGTAGGETLINTSWNDLTLPDGFPKLADGVTNYSSMDSLVTMSWNALPKSDAEAMVTKLESWSGASAEKTDMDGTFSWHLDNGSSTIDLNYYTDTFGGAMDQVMLSVMIFE